MKKTLNEIEKKEYAYLIRVLSAAVNGTEAPLPYKNINWNSVIYRAHKCGFDSAFASTVLSLPKEHLPKEDVINILEKKINIGVFIDSNLNFEIEKLLKTFDENGVKNVPVKGYFMKKEYPRSDFRSVSDFDILFDEKQIETVSNAFDKLGYKFIHNDDNQFHFRKEPYIYVEMHTTLVHEFEYYYPYLFDALEKSIKRENYGFSYELSVEDHYLYMIIHSSNHFRLAGLSVRMLLDLYVYYRNHKDGFDYEYLNERLKLYKLDTFEKRVREIAFDWFSPDKQLIKFDDFEVFVLLSATLGRVETSVMISSHKHIMTGKNNGKKKTKFSYFIKNVFPGRNVMYVDYPYVNKYPFLLPVSWSVMWFKRFFVFKNVNVKKGLKNRFSYTEKDTEYYKNLLNEAGFEDFNF